MYNIVKFINNNSGIISLVTLLFMVYEFYWKKRLNIKCVAMPSVANFDSNMLIVNFEVLNLSEQSLGRIDKIGIWIKRWNSYGNFYEIKLQNAKYKEKVRFSLDIRKYLENTIKKVLEEQKKLDKFFSPKIKLVFKTTTDKEIEIIISDELKEILENYLRKVEI